MMFNVILVNFVQKDEIVGCRKKFWYFLDWNFLDVLSGFLV